MKKISADVVITNTGAPLTNHTVICDDTGKILAIESSDLHSEAQHHRGVLVPGYINAHCHLELSHLKGVIPTGTGLVPFIQGILSQRDFPEEEVMAAIQAADQEMSDNGIVAVGDISNKSDTAATKRASKLRYHTFVEMFDLFQPFMTAETISTNQEVYDSHSDQQGHKKSFVPHAPYSVSPAIYEFIRANNKSDATVSIHNQELTAENEFFQHKTGKMISFYESIGLSLEAFTGSGKNSINYAIEHMDPSQRTLFVHNTASQAEDIALAQSWSPYTYWATCPNANLYIENKLPQYDLFGKADAIMCIGTDSLSSNWSLSIYEEMKTIKRYQSALSDIEIIRWATANGADALGYSDLGRIAVGTSPGFNLIEVPIVDGVFNLNQATGSIKLL